MFFQSSTPTSFGSSQLTTNLSTSLLPLDRSGFNDPLMQTNFLKVSAAELPWTTDLVNTSGSAVDLGTLSTAPAPYSDSASSSPNSYYGLSAASTPPTDSDFVQRVLDLTNQFRAQNGVAPLSLNPELNAAALNHSTDMALQDYFSHTGKDGSSPGDRMNQVGYASYGWGENIAAGYTTPEQVVQGWINSPGHRANMLNPSYTELGVGYYHFANDTGSVNYTNYWTQDFGSGDINPATNIPV